MKKIACFFNGPYLGGAERSFILQTLSVQKTKSLSLDFIIPILQDRSEAKAIIDELKDHDVPRADMTLFTFDKKLYAFSRKHKLLGLPLLVASLIKTIRNLAAFELRYHDCWWVNGNKIGFVCFLYGLIFAYKGTFLWHFRDYPAAHGLWRFVWKILSLPLPFRLRLIANSYDVAEALKQIGFNNVETLYNPVENWEHQPLGTKRDHGAYRLGVVAMLAPWKGLHDIVKLVALYEDHLKQLGVGEVVFYGGSLYQTEGDHNYYEGQLHSLCEKLSPSLITFAGLKKPRDIFCHLDLLIHSSNRREPFGRVIAEAFAAGVPVLSTGLGGAGELVEHKKSGFLYDRYDPLSFIEGVKTLLEEKEHFVEGGYQSHRELQEKIKQQIKEIFS